MQDRNDYNVIVAGGGLTGVAAAVASARGGARTLLIERYGCLGGMATVGHVNPFMPYYQAERAAPGQEVVRGIFLEMLERLKKESNVLIELRKSDGSRGDDPGHKPRLWPGNTAFDTEVLKWILDEIVLESGADLRLHTFITNASMENNTIKRIDTESKSGRQSFSADVFIDTTGDADVVYRAGFETIYGRENDGKAQAMTVMFRLGDIDTSYFGKNNIQGLFQEAVARGEIKNPGKKIVLMFPYPGKGVVTFNQNEIAGLSPVESQDLTTAEIQGRKAIRELVAFLRKHAAGFEHCRIEQIAPQVGIRESRRIVGEYTLTVEDLLERVEFDDTVACGAYPVDIHDPEGKNHIPMKHLEPGTYYRIPYRSFVVKGAHNVLAAGRCLSATHEAAASVRVMPICAAMGQAVGEAAAIAAEKGSKVGEINTDELRKRLTHNGVFIGE